MFDFSKPIAIGSDHAGYDYKMALVKWLTEKGYKINDKGVDENKSVDYPDYAHPVADSVEKGDVAFGILLCGSANGVWLIRLHNDANVICIPARFVSLEDAKQMIEIFISTPFEGGRHQTRVNKIACV